MGQGIMSYMSKQKPITLKGVTAQCVLVSHPRAKRLRVTVLSTGLVRLTKPKYISDAQAIIFAEENAGWIMERYKKIRDNIVSPEEAERHYKKYKEEARKLIASKASHWNRFYGFEYGDIRIKKPRTMWGSCSSKGNLNFNYRLIFLPEELIDYIVVHELCHLKEMNHSKKFWDLVAKTMPNHRELRRRLKEYS